MNVAVLGVNHKTACLAVREQVALTDEGCRQLAQDLCGRPGVSEAVALSTCNRTELYVAGQGGSLEEAALNSLCANTAACHSDLVESVYFHEGPRAIEHLFMVAGSLDSMVLGEAQILAQLKNAYGLAESAGTTGTMLNKLMRRSFEVGKRVRTETRIGEASLSIASVSVDLARNVFGELAGRSALVIGAGEMAELVVTHLKGHGISRIAVTNRTFHRAVQLAEKCDGDAVQYEGLLDHLAAADIVISSTAAPHPIIDRATMEQVMRRRRNRPVFLIDIAVPRDIDPAVNKLNNAYLYDIDDLQDVVASNLDERQREAVSARAIVREEVGLFEEWMASLSVVPTLVALREWANSVKDEELQKHLAKMPELTEEERNKVGALAHALVNKFLHPPTVRMKGLAGDEEGYRHAESLRVLFGLNGAAAASSGGEDETEVGSKGASVNGAGAAEAARRPERSQS
jgi:glutamyl-tRNA reductase